VGINVSRGSEGKKTSIPIRDAARTGTIPQAPRASQVVGMKQWDQRVGKKKREDQKKESREDNEKVEVARPPDHLDQKNGVLEKDIWRRGELTTGGNATRTREE